MLIRPEQPADYTGIAEVTTSAFASAEHRGGNEAEIVSRLRSDGDLAVSLVAEEDGDILGHVGFSPVAIDGVHRGWFGLGPVSVRPDRQRQGLGSALIRHGLDQLRARGAAGCVVLGGPAYYRRFGFETGARLRYEEAPPEFFMRLHFGAGERPAGRVTYPPAFSG